MSKNICPECKENTVEEYNLEVPGICDSCQEHFEPNDKDAGVIDELAKRSEEE